MLFALPFHACVGLFGILSFSPCSVPKTSDPVGLAAGPSVACFFVVFVFQCAQCRRPRVAKEEKKSTVTSDIMTDKSATSAAGCLER